MSIPTQVRVHLGKRVFGYRANWAGLDQDQDLRRVQIFLGFQFQPQIVRLTRFVWMAGTWKSICTYSTFTVNKAPTCCVSLSTFYNPKITPCPLCSCDCRPGNSNTLECVGSVTLKAVDGLPQSTCPRSKPFIKWAVLRSHPVGPHLMNGSDLAHVPSLVDWWLFSPLTEMIWSHHLGRVPTTSTIYCNAPITCAQFKYTGT